MFKKIKLLSLLLFAVIIHVSAQNQPTALQTFKYGKVELKEFEIKGSGQDSAAAAVKIFDVGKGYFEVSQQGNFVYIFERHVRYKIINKNGYDLADQEIRLYNDGKGSEEKLELIKAATYNLNNKVIETSKMASEAKFSTRQDKNRTIKKFTLPNVKEGSIIEYSYKTKSDFVFRLDDWYFQGAYPCIYSGFALTIPEYYNYKISVNGFLQIQFIQPVRQSQNYHIPGGTVSQAGGNIAIGTTKGQYYAENVSAIKEENFITTLDDYVSKISFELTSTSFPDGGYKDYTSTWKKIASELMEQETFGGFIKRKNYDKNLLSSILKGETDSAKKMKLIFNYVKEQVKWDDKYGVYTKASSPKAVLEKKSGNMAEINLLLLNILNEAGIEAFPVLISTRKNGKHPGYPMLSKFNSVIVWSKVGEKPYLLDASDKNNTIDLISYAHLNHQGLKVNTQTKDAEWISTENSAVSRDVIFYALKMDEDHKFTGSLSLTSDNYLALGKRSQYLSAVNEAEFIKGYKSDKPGLEISNYKITNLNEPESPLNEVMDVSIEDNMEDAGNLSYFMPLLFERTKENPFPMEERQFPVDFAYVKEEYYRITIEFPEKYSIDKLPASEKYVLPDNAGSFTITYAKQDHTIAVTSKIILKKSFYTADDYFNLKELFKNIVRKQAEQVIIKKS